jgi:hypothetical protein
MEWFRSHLPSVLLLGLGLEGSYIRHGFNNLDGLISVGGIH